MMGKMLVFAALVFLFGLHVGASAATSKKMFTRRLMLCVIVLLMVFVRPLSAAVEFVAAGALVGGTGAQTAVWPTHQSGDVALLIVETANQAATPMLSIPAGFVEVTNSPQGTGTGGDAAATRLAVFWKRAASSAEANPRVADSGNHQIAMIITFRGVIASGNPWDVTAGDVAATASTSVLIPGATTTVPNTFVVAIVCNGTDTDIAQTSGWTNANLLPTSLTEQADGGSFAGNGGGFGVATGDWASIGAYGTTTATLATSSTQGRMSIALKPAEFMYWSGDFSPSTIELANIANRTDAPEGSSQITLSTSGNAEISADNTTAAQLTYVTSGDKLVTEYKLTFDGDGDPNTGGETVNWTLHNNFLTTPSAVTHFPGDDAVQVTLSVRASNYTGQLADAGDYSATQTLTVSWVVP
jgi:hypothetical protein